MKNYLFEIKRLPQICLFVMIFFVQTGLTQITARSLGMGFAYTALARGVYAPAYNPANLGLPDNYKFSMTFLSGGAGFRNNSFSKSDYDFYLVDHPEWDQNDVKNILNRIPEEGFQADVRGMARAFSFAVGKFAFTLGAEMGSFMETDKDIFLIPFQGNELDRTYTLNQVNGEGMGLGFFGLSWGQPINVSFADAFAVGASLNFLYGLEYFQVEKATGSITTRLSGFEVDGDYQVSESTGKRGMNIDLGAAAQFGDRLTLSLALGNIYGSTKWSIKETNYGYVRGDSLTIYKIADEEDEALEDSSWSIESGNSFSRKLPLIIRLGSAYQAGRLILTADYHQGFTKNAWATRKPQFSLGMEWQGLKWLPLRAGLITGGQLGFGTSFGFGISPSIFSLDIGVMNGGFIVPSSAKGFVLALDFGMEVN